MLKRIIILIMFCCICFTSQSQIFVDDVERVSLVVIDYCVDENGERYDIKINDEKTTYRIEGWQQGCIEHFNNGKLMFPLTMVNECWQAVYYFVNSKYKTASLVKEDQEKCKIFHTGEYRYENPAYNTTEIIRRKNKQIEKSPDKNQRQVYKINWIEDHIYTLETIRLPLEKDKHKIGRLINVEIIEVLNKNAYLYRAYVKDDPDILYGIISKVN